MHTQMCTYARVHTYTHTHAHAHTVMKATYNSSPDSVEHGLSAAEEVQKARFRVCCQAVLSAGTISTSTCREPDRGTEISPVLHGTAHVLKT